MEFIPYGTEVLISSADAYHNGHVGVVCSLGDKHWTSTVQVGDCVHTFHNSKLWPMPEQDTIPEPVDI